MTGVEDYGVRDLAVFTEEGEIGTDACVLGPRLSFYRVTGYVVSGVERSVGVPEELQGRFDARAY